MTVVHGVAVLLIHEVAVLLIGFPGLPVELLGLLLFAFLQQLVETSRVIGVRFCSHAASYAAVPS